MAMEDGVRPRWRVLWSLVHGARSVDKSLQVCRHRHRPEAADVRAAGVSGGHPKPGLQRCADDAPGLADRFGGDVLPQGPAEHRPVDAHVVSRGLLTQDMGALQVHEGGDGLASGFEARCGGELGLDAGLNSKGEVGIGEHR